jgi:prevent-host-death family protein
MEELGVRELKAHASEIVREIKDKHKQYVVTRRGRPVALLIPVQEPALEVTGSADDAEAWQELICLGQEISRGWQSPLSSVELLSATRR